MKRMLCLMLALTLALGGCAQPSGQNGTTEPSGVTEPGATVVSGGAAQTDADAISIALKGDAVDVEENAGVYTANDIVYYEAGRDHTYGEGEPGDAHEAAEAAAHTVVHITRPGTYRLSGTLDAGQIAVDLGDGAQDDPTAVVTLILDGVDITCTVAPAIIFYNVYECGSTDADAASPTVDTSAAGANVVIADGSVNTVNGSYVARIYKEGTVVLDEDGEVEDAKKLHKYDGAFYSKMSMNVTGGAIGDGTLTIHAENEGLDSELHLTINGGHIIINSGNDGINTNEDEVSVTTINGGHITINVLGTTGEGDGIDSNGWLVINGGTVSASACGFSDDAGIDSDMGIYLNGGTVIASGNMLDTIAGGQATWAVFQFAAAQPGGTVVTMKNEAGEEILRWAPVNDFTSLVFSGEALAPGTYTLWADDVQMAASGMMGMGGSGFPGGGEGFEEMPGGVPGQFEGEPPEGDYQIPEQPGGQMQTQGGVIPGGTVSDGTEPPQGAGSQITLPGEFDQQRPEGDYQIPEQPGVTTQPQGGGFGGQRPDGMGQTGLLSEQFLIVQGGNYFMNVAPVQTAG